MPKSKAVKEAVVNRKPYSVKGSSVRLLSALIMSLGNLKIYASLASLVVLSGILHMVSSTVVSRYIFEVRIIADGKIFVGAIQTGDSTVRARIQVLGEYISSIHKFSFIESDRC